MTFSQSLDIEPYCYSNRHETLRISGLQPSKSTDEKCTTSQRRSVCNPTDMHGWSMLHYLPAPFCWQQIKFKIQFLIFLDCWWIHLTLLSLWLCMLVWLRMDIMLHSEKLRKFGIWSQMTSQELFHSLMSSARTHICCFMNVPCLRNILKTSQKGTPSPQGDFKESPPMFKPFWIIGK